MSAKTVIIGLGNPYLSDDAVGIRVAKVLEERYEGNDTVDIIEAYAGGIALLDHLAGYRKAVIIDAMQTFSARPGEIRIFNAGDIPMTKNTVSTHDTNLPTALAAGRALGLDLPEDIRIIGIGTETVDVFSESLTPLVASSVPAAVETAMREAGL